MTHDRSPLKVRLKELFASITGQIAQATESLRREGIVVIDSFLDPETTEDFAGQVECSLEAGRNAGYASFATLKPVRTTASIEFNHPFVVSTTTTAPGFKSGSASPRRPVRSYEIDGQVPVTPGTTVIVPC